MCGALAPARARTMVANKDGGDAAGGDAVERCALVEEGGEMEIELEAEAQGEATLASRAHILTNSGANDDRKRVVSTAAAATTATLDSPLRFLMRLLLLAWDMVFAFLVCAGIDILVNHAIELGTRSS